jgi:hypothetical protein
MNNARELITALENDLFELADRVEVLLGPVMDAIHQLEADQPMLSFIKSSWGKLQKHFAQFSADNPEQAKGKISADRPKRNSQPTPISLVQLLVLDRIIVCFRTYQASVAIYIAPFLELGAVLGLCALHAHCCGRFESLTGSLPICLVL